MKNGLSKVIAIMLALIIGLSSFAAVVYADDAPAAAGDGPPFCQIFLEKFHRFSNRLIFIGPGIWSNRNGVSNF